MCHIFPEETEWRVRANDISLLQKLHALRASEVPIALQRPEIEALDVGFASDQYFSVEIEVTSLLFVAITEEVGLAVLVAGRDEALQAEIVEVIEEVSCEV